MAIATQVNDGDVAAFLAGVADPVRRADAQDVAALMREITGAVPRMWGHAIVGFGSRPYTNASGTHDWFVHVKRVSAIDRGVLAALIRAAWEGATG
jgi:hypothetical protein